MRILGVLSWIMCEFLALTVSSSVDSSVILKDFLNAIDISNLNLKCSAKTLDNYTAGVDNEDIHLNVTELIAKYKYPVQEHHVTTEDGYILTIIRMPNKGPPVLLMHGLLCSADDFVTTNLPNSIAYNLWLEGYEVWMGNARGNKYSRKHVTLNPDTDKDFWNFSWDEIGRIDLTTIIDYILAKTGRSQLVYIGHSQGTTAYFVMCSEKPEYNDKIALMISLSTVAYMSRLRSPIVQSMAPYSEDLEQISQSIGYFEVLPSNLLTKSFTAVLCSEPNLASIFCANMVSIFCGSDCAQIDWNTIAVVYGHLPAGSAVKQLIHYLQGVKSGKFRKYDLGPSKNLKVYGTAVPTDYDVKKITSPVAMFHSENDWLSNYADVEELVGQLPNVVGVYKVPLPKFNHMDYLFAKDFKKLVYSKILELVMKYSPNQKQ